MALIRTTSLVLPAAFAATIATAQGMPASMPMGASGASMPMHMPASGALHARAGAAGASTPTDCVASKKHDHGADRGMPRAASADCDKATKAGAAASAPKPAASVAPHDHPQTQNR